jgi:hypothetical protein
MLVNYRISYILLGNFGGVRQRYMDSLVALAPVGVEVTPVGQYRIFDVRALWRAAS